MVITPLIVISIVWWYIVRIQVTIEMNTAMKQYSPDYSRRRRFAYAFFFGWIWPLTVLALVLANSLVMDRNPGNGRRG